MATKVAKQEVKKGSGDDALLFHAMYVMATVDGQTSEAEFGVLKGVLSTLPDFATSKIDALVSASIAIAKKHGGNLESVAALTEISDKFLRLRAYMLAAEIAYASGDINPAEELLLSSMERLLSLEHNETSQILWCLSIKYCRS